MKILVLHGPNLNMLADINTTLMELGKEFGADLKCFQSNHEGALIDALQEAKAWAEGVLFNPAGYTHTSVALCDVISAIGIPVIEVHLSNGMGARNSDTNR